MQNVTKCNDLFESNDEKCVGINDFDQKVSSSNNFIVNIQNARKTLGLLEQSLLKTSKYEDKLARCRNSHNHSRNSHSWWESAQSEQKGSSNSSVSGGGQAESWSTLSIACLHYHLCCVLPGYNPVEDCHVVFSLPDYARRRVKFFECRYKELSKRYEALLEAYDDQCREICVRDIRLCQWRQRANSYHAQLAHAHKSLLTVGEKYLALRRKRSELKSLYEKKLSRMKSILPDVVKLISNEQLRFDAKLSHYMSVENKSDAELLLDEMRKCNLLFLENIRLKTIIEEYTSGQASWK